LKPFYADCASKLGAVGNGADFLTLYLQPLPNQPIYKLFEVITLLEVKYIECLLPVGEKKLGVWQSLPR